MVLLPNVFHTERDFTRLSEALRGLPRSTPLGEKPFVLPPEPPKAMPLSQALLASERVRAPIAQALGRVCAGVVCPCPPGIPVVMPGELVTKEAVQFLSRLGVDGIEVVDSTAKKGKIGLGSFSPGRKREVNR